MNRSHRIAFLARRYRLLSERPELLTADRAELVERILASPIPVGEFDRTLILHAGEIDRLCAYTVRALSDRCSAAVLDVLGVLDPDRLVAVYYALPSSRRESVRRDPAWGYHVGHAPDGIAEAVAEVDELASITQTTTSRLSVLAAQTTSEARGTTERMERAVLREEVGLPSEVMPGA